MYIYTYTKHFFESRRNGNYEKEQMNEMQSARATIDHLDVPDTIDHLNVNYRRSKH